MRAILTLLTISILGTGLSFAGTYIVSHQCQDFIVISESNNDALNLSVKWQEQVLFSQTINSQLELESFIDQLEQNYQIKCNQSLSVEADLACVKRGENSISTKQFQDLFVQWVNVLDVELDECDPFVQYRKKHRESEQSKLLDFINGLFRLEQKSFVKTLVKCPVEMHPKIMAQRIYYNAPKCFDYSKEVIEVKDIEKIIRESGYHTSLQDYARNKKFKEYEMIESKIAAQIIVSKLLKKYASVIDINSIVAASHKRLEGYKRNTRHKDIVSAQQNYISQGIYGDAVERLVAQLAQKNLINKACVAKVRTGADGCAQKNKAITAISDIDKCIDEKKIELALKEYDNRVENLLEVLSPSITVESNYRERLLECVEITKEDICLDKIWDSLVVQKLNSELLKQFAAVEATQEHFTNYVKDLDMNKDLLTCGKLHDKMAIESCLVDIRTKHIKDYLSLRLSNSPEKKEVFEKTLNDCTSSSAICLKSAIIEAIPTKSGDMQLGALSFDKFTPTSFSYLINYVDQNINFYPEIIRKDLEKNVGSYYCKRDPQFVNTIVFHHTATPQEDTIEDVNRYHLIRSPSDPWLMVGYHYLIRDESDGAKIYKGREDDLVGAHAGGEATSRNYPQRLEDGLVKSKLKCGRYDQKLYPQSVPFIDGKVKANVTTTAVAFIGNYSVMSQSNPLGYARGTGPKYPSDKTLRVVARLSCMLQNQNPNIKNLGYHGQYKSTSCPGDVKELLGKIANLAKEYGCQFAY